MNGEIMTDAMLAPDSPYNPDNSFSFLVEEECLIDENGIEVMTSTYLHIPKTDMMTMASGGVGTMVLHAQARTVYEEKTYYFHATATFDWNTVNDTVTMYDYSWYRGGQKKAVGNIGTMIYGLLHILEEESYGLLLGSHIRLLLSMALTAGPQVIILIIQSKSRVTQTADTRKTVIHINRKTSTHINGTAVHWTCR